MATPSTAPSTPDGKAKIPLNRSFTVPAKLSSSPIVEGTPMDAIETLFHHPNANVFKFTTRTPSAGDAFKEKGLPWTSPRETRVAVGGLEVYRVPGSVSFLRSGDLLYTIMPRSQCWCVDGISKFAMRVMQDTYYRIELPADSQEDRNSIEEFKKVLGTVMHYERSACPFARGFAEDLPEMEDISERKMSKVGTQWLQDRKASLKKVREASAGLAPLKQRSVTMTSIPKTSNEQLEITSSAGESEAKSQAERIPERPSVSQRSVTVPSRLQMYELAVATASAAAKPGTDRSNTVLQTIPTDMPPSPPYSSTEQEVDDDRLKELSLHTPQADVDETQQIPHVAVDEEQLVPTLGEQLPDEQREMGGIDETVLEHEAEATDQSLLPAAQLHESILESEPKSEEAMPVNEEATSDPGIEQRTTMQAHQEHEGDPFNPPSATPITSTVPRPSSSSSDDPFAAIQARILARRSIGGTTSFYPSIPRESTSCSTTSVNSSSTVSSSRSHVSQLANQNMATALVKKACSICLGPPAHLVLMMLRIAARVSNGTFGKMLFVESPSGSNQRVPGSFSVSEEAFGEGLSDEEDDFGVPLDSPIRVATARGLRERKARDFVNLD